MRYYTTVRNSDLRYIPVDSWDSFKVCVSHIMTGDQGRLNHVDGTTSRSLCEVKQRQARLVLQWGATRKALVLFISSFVSSNRSVHKPERHILILAFVATGGVACEMWSDTDTCMQTSI